jgi:hypothetical protein
VLTVSVTARARNDTSHVPPNFKYKLPVPAPCWGRQATRDALVDVLSDVYHFAANTVIGRFIFKTSVIFFILFGERMR